MTAAELAALRGSALERMPAIAAIVAAVAGAFGIPPAEVLGRDRSKTVMEARLIAYYLARHCTRYSYPQLGRAFERDHTTVLSGVAHAAALISADPWLGATTRRLFEELSNEGDDHPFRRQHQEV